MTTYSIYFESNYGERQNYAFFCEPPVISGSTGEPQPYSNVFLSNSVADGGNWTIDITKTYYAWCGLAPSTLKPGVKVTSGNGKLVTLGPHGSTWTMFNNGGSPAFDPTEGFTSNAGAFEIDTGTDFDGNQNFLIGLGAVDGNGRMKPVATMEAPRNARVNFAPVTRFYIAAFSSSVGTAIQTSAISKEAATIDFSRNPGKFGANVVQDSFGKFSVMYYNDSAGFGKAIAAKRARDLSLISPKLRRALQSALELLDLGNTSKPIYECSVDWVGVLTEQQKESVYKGLRKYMERSEYSYFGDESGPMSLVIKFEHEQPWSLDRAVDDWTTAWFQLPDGTRQYCNQPQVAEDPNTALDGSLKAMKLLSLKDTTSPGKAKEREFQPADA